MVFPRIDSGSLGARATHDEGIPGLVTRLLGARVAQASCLSRFYPLFRFQKYETRFQLKR